MSEPSTVQPGPTPKLMGRGAYGCVYRPGISCDGDVKLTDKYITKVQPENDTTEHERLIGEKVQKIKNYADYYAPILSMCEASLSNVSTQEIEKCDILPLGASTYAASKLRYVGKNTLMKHMLKTYTTRTMGITSNIVESHNILLEGYKRLNENGIMHFDVKESNIMCEDRGGAPVIIDFGLSAEMSKLGRNDYKDVFYTYGPDYGPWCLDIAMISYGANELSDKSSGPSDEIYLGFRRNEQLLTGLDQLVTNEQLNTVIGDFEKKNYVMIELMSKIQREKYTKSMKTYYSKYIGKSWRDMITELATYANTWDNYGLTVAYLYIIQNLKLSEHNPINTYKTYLEEIVLSLPSDRPTCDKTMTAVLKLFSNVNRRDKRKQDMQIKDYSMKKGNKEEVRKRVWGSIQSNLLRDTAMRKPVRRLMV
jgi:serine/threonine protein kinase